MGEWIIYITMQTKFEPDLSNVKFDIFVGGIINTQREKSFQFSQPLVSSYKAAMVRFNDINKYIV